MQIDFRHALIQKNVIAQDGETGLKVTERPFEGIGRALEDVTLRPEIAVVGLDVIDKPFGDLLDLSRAQLDLEGIDNGPGDFLLNIKHVIERAGIFLGPDVGIVRGVDELGGDPEIVPGLADTAPSMT
ncbi:MAG: hypothetical protein NT006_11250 [Candidatus Aminicenantes bacterium]|nr:hypothetical protein [Candidatus Aminicenantes bacterium]